MELYGSISNRFEENNYFNGTKGNLEEGTLCTVYLYSDSHAYVVSKVINQEHVFIKRLKAIRTDDCGCSDWQNYRFEIVENAKEIELELTKKGWKEVIRYTQELYNEIMNKHKFCIWDREIINKVTIEGKSVKRSKPINVSFGVAKEYYDYSF